MADLDKVGLLVLDIEQRILLCQKKHTTSRLILPGGCRESGETDEQCLHREIAEELGGVQPAHLRLEGRYWDLAHCDDPSVRRTLELHLYRGDLIGDPCPTSEITALVWFGPDADPECLTPIFRNQILPDLRSRGVISW